MPKTINTNHGLVLFNPWIGSLSSATTLDESGHRSDCMEGVLSIP